MKRLEQLDNVQRAKLLHELLPASIQGFIDYAKGSAVYMQAHQSEIAQSWDGQFFSFDAWLELAKDAEKRIDRYSDQLCKSSRLFSDQLFDGPTGIWSGDTLFKYVNQPGFNNPQFKAMATCFFGASQPEPTEAHFTKPLIAV